MIEKIKYILFDFSDGFKNDFFNTFKKTIIFLIAGAVCLPLSGVNEVFSVIGGLGIVVFGFLWGREFVASISSFGNFMNNSIFKLFWIIFMFLIALTIGYIYFAWCVIKIIIFYIKKATKNNN